MAASVENRQFRHELGVSAAGVVRSFSPNHRRSDSPIRGYNYPAAAREFMTPKKLPLRLTILVRMRKMKDTIVMPLKSPTPSWKAPFLIQEIRALRINGSNATHRWFDSPENTRSTPSHL